MSTRKANRAHTKSDLVKALQKLYITQHLLLGAIEKAGLTIIRDGDNIALAPKEQKEPA